MEDTIKDVDVWANNFMTYLGSEAVGFLVKFKVLDDSKGFTMGSDIPLTGKSFVYGVILPEHKLLTYSYGIVDHYDNIAVRPVQAWIAISRDVSHMLQPVDILALCGRDYDQFPIDGSPLYTTFGRMSYTVQPPRFSELSPGSWCLMGKDGLSILSGERVSLLDAYQMGQKFFYPIVDENSRTVLTLHDYIMGRDKNPDSLAYAFSGLDSGFDALGIF